MHPPKKLITPVDKDHPVLTETLRLLNNLEEPLAHTADRTGVPKWWLYDLKRGRIAQPAANRLLRLYESLSGNKVSTTHA